MSTVEDYVNSGKSFSINPGDWKSSAAYRCQIALMREDDDSYSAIVLNLPGAGSCGQTADEALENVKEAVAGLIKSYSDTGTSIPWKDVRKNDIPEGAELRWILVNA
jgi:predicted RNase H-like HicB family nuclease